MAVGNFRFTYNIKKNFLNDMKSKKEIKKEICAMIYNL